MRSELLNAVRNLLSASRVAGRCYRPATFCCTPCGCDGMLLDGPRLVSWLAPFRCPERLPSGERFSRFFCDRDGSPKGRDACGSVHDSPARRDRPIVSHHRFTVRLLDAYCDR